VLGGDDQAAHLALNLARLDCDVILCANGPPAASDAANTALAARQIRVCADLVSKVEGEPGRYIRLHLAAAEGARAAVVIDQELLFTDAYREAPRHS
jgi:hypothetical protein